MRVIPALAIAITLALALAPPAWTAERSLITPAPAGGTLANTPAAAEQLKELARGAEDQGRVGVVVGLRVPFASEGDLPRAAALTQRRDIASVAQALRARLGSGRTPAAFRAYSALPFVALRVTPSELKRLASDPDVISITQDFALRSSLAQSAPLIRAPEAWRDGYTGVGQVIAVLDTGIDKDHPFLKDRVVSEACYSQGGYCPGGATSSTAAGSGVPCLREPCFHGTHVAGIAAGRGNDMSGVAKGAGVISIQVFSPDTGSAGVVAWFSDILAGLNRVSELRALGYNIAAVNLSLASGRHTSSCDKVKAYKPILVAIANLRSAGVVTVAAAGNDGWPDALAFPACLSGVVSVGSVSDGDWGNCWGQPTAADRVACYSNSSQLLSLLAPGSSIVSSVPGGGLGSANGTSMAAPHVAGAWAVMRQKFPDATVSEMLAALQASGKPVVDDRTAASKRPVVKPRIDLAAALGRLVRLSVSQSGTGSGSVTIATSRGSTSCPGSCSSPILSGTVVKLTAKAARGARFAGWSGGACVSTKPCTLTLSEARSVTATFTKR